MSAFVPHAITPAPVPVAQLQLSVKQSRNQPGLRTTARFAVMSSIAIGLGLGRSWAGGGNGGAGTKGIDKESFLG